MTAMTNDAEQLAATMPTFSQCVIGYRGWNIDALGRLRPLTMDHAAWKPGINVAKCHRDALGLSFTLTVSGQPLTPPAGASAAHAAPAERCGCGLYAYHSIGMAIPGGSYPSDDALADAIPVIGAVAALGRLRVHHHGFRAERAGVVALALLPGMGPLARRRLEEVAQSYRVACVDLYDLEHEASRHGSPLPRSAMPAKPPERPPMSGTGITHGLGSSPLVMPPGVFVTYARSPMPARVPSRWPIVLNAFGALANAGLWAVNGHAWYSAACALVCVGAALDGARRRRNRTPASGVDHA